MVRNRKWGKSNTFSELHRKNVPGYLCLFDLDGVYTKGEEIVGIYEGKYSVYSKDKGNFIDLFDDESNIQGRLLKNISRSIPVWIREESTDKWWKVENGKLSQSPPNTLEFIDTSDRIYVGYRLSKYSDGSIYSIFHRTLGNKPPKDDLISSSISSILKCSKVLVNDSIDGRIYFKNPKLESHLEASIEEGSDWTTQWKELGLI